MALMRRTRVLRAVGWLGCWLIEIPRVHDVDQATLDAYIAALAEHDSEATHTFHIPDEYGVRAAGNARALDSVQYGPRPINPPWGRHFDQERLAVGGGPFCFEQRLKTRRRGRSPAHRP
jgi:hypothetical protein